MALITEIRDAIQDRRLIRTVMPYTLVGPERIRNLIRLVRSVENKGIPGDVIECGVCNGGTAAVLARVATRSPIGRTVWLLDSFQGMPTTTSHDELGAGGETAESYVGQVVGDERRVREVLMKVNADLGKVRINPGWFRDTFPLVTAKQISLLNIDADWYESVKLCLETFYDRVVPGGFVSIDDYGYWPGCRKAVDEFFALRNINSKLHRVDQTAHWFQKE